jgi:hypothetical protein
MSIAEMEWQPQAGGDYWLMYRGMLVAWTQVSTYRTGWAWGVPDARAFGHAPSLEDSKTAVEEAILAYEGIDGRFRREPNE